MLSFKWSFIFLLLVGTIWSFEAITSHNPYIERSVFGIWDVTRFESDGQTLYSREDLGDTWTKLIFEAQFGGKRAVLLTQDQRTMATYDINEDSGHLELYGRGMSFIGQYELQTDHSMVLTGRRGDDSVHVELTRR